MGDLIVSLAGTPAGEAMALAFALLSALAHAIFGAVNKSGADPVLNRGAINVAYALIAAPLAFFVFPFPGPAVWAVLAVSYFVHILYEWLQATSFSRGAFTLVYPIARGAGPLATAGLAMIVFGERLTLAQWGGLALLSGAILGLAFANMRVVARDAAALKGLRSAVLAALGAGGMIAVYTTVDAYGVRLAVDPFSFIVWFFFLGGFGFPIIAVARWRSMAPASRPELSDLAVRGVFGAIIAYFSFGALMLATRLDKVGEAAALRETSIVFGTAIGVLIFREKIDLTRLGLIGLIALGAILVELA